MRQVRIKLALRLSDCFDLASSHFRVAQLGKSSSSPLTLLKASYLFSTRSTGCGMVGKSLETLVHNLLTSFAQTGYDVGGRWSDRAKESTW